MASNEHHMVVLTSQLDWVREHCRLLDGGLRCKTTGEPITAAPQEVRIGDSPHTRMAMFFYCTKCMPNPWKALPKRGDRVEGEYMPIEAIKALITTPS